MVSIIAALCGVWIRTFHSRVEAARMAVKRTGAVLMSRILPLTPGRAIVIRRAVPRVFLLSTVCRKVLPVP